MPSEKPQGISLADWRKKTVARLNDQNESLPKPPLPGSRADPNSRQSLVEQVNLLKPFRTRDEQAGMPTCTRSEPRRSQDIPIHIVESREHIHLRLSAP
jgi:hypothetical protein